MLLRIIHYATALVVLSGTSVVYQNLVTPRLQPPPIESIAMASRSAVRVDRSLQALFPPGAWQRGDCRELKTSNMTLLFRQYDQQSDDRLSLSPVTVIIGYGLTGPADDNPIIIDAAQGAEITFTEPINVLGAAGRAPAIQGGRIAGDVHIHRAADDQRHAFDLRTSNIGIGRKKIWTTDAIDLRFGDARCLGRDLTVHLVAAAASARGDALLDRMELIYLDELTIPVRSASPPGAAAQTASAERSMVSVHCDGRLEYDFAIDMVTLFDAVSFIHQQPGSAADEFRCDRLTMSLNDPTNQAIAREGPLDWVTEIIAAGSPAAAILPSFDAEVMADSIRLSASRGLLQASGKAGVQARFGGISARLANLFYQFDAKHPKMLGAIDVQGAGIVQVREDNLPLRKLQWRDRFKLFPVAPTSGQDALSEVELQVDGDFHAWLSEGGEVQADSFAGVLVPRPKSDSDAEMTLVPDRFIADGQVRIDTTAVAAQTDQLIVHFVDDPDPQPPTDAGGDPSDAQGRQWIAQPGGPTAITTPVARARPSVRGDQINAQLRRDADGLSPKRLSIVGHVEAKHEMVTGGQALPVHFTGDRLQLVDGSGQDVVQITGSSEKPARFDFGDGFFVGPEIQIWPSDNLVLINSAGEFRMPTAALPQGLPDQPDQKFEWLSPPHCRWQGEMRFDGRTALLTGGVQIDASLTNDRQPWDLILDGDRLQIDLLQDVQVRDLQSMRNASIQGVALLRSPSRPVTVQAIQRATDGVVESKHLIHAEKLTYAPAAGGAVVGNGPGWYRGWFLSAGNALISGEGPGGTESTEASGLSGVHLMFAESMRADLTARTLDFARGVRVGVRPVRDWDQSFDAAAMDAIASGESTLDCDQLRLAIAPGFTAGDRNGGLPLPWEVAAQHGVVFRTRSDKGLIESRASRAAYTSGKQLFTIDGVPNRPAEIRQSRPDGSVALDLAVRTTTIHLGSMRIVNSVPERLVIPPSQGR